MRTLPTAMIRVLDPFAPLFSERVFEHVQVLLAGAILAPGKRTVSSAKGVGTVRRTAWYDKRHPSFSDALAQVRRQLWAQEQATFCGSARGTDMVKVPREFMEQLTDAVCYAA